MYHNRWLQSDDDAPSSKKKRQSWHLSYIMRHFVDRVWFHHTKAPSAYSPRHLQNWRTNNKRLACTFTGHAGTVYCLQFDDEKLVTGSTDATIKVWDLKGQVRHSLTGHTARIRCLRYNDTMLASGSVVRPCTCMSARRLTPVPQDHSIKLWNLADLTLVRTLTGHTKYVYCVQFVDNMLVTGSGGAHRSLHTSSASHSPRPHSEDVGP